MFYYKHFLILINEVFLYWSHDDRCVKSVRIRGYSGPHFPAFGLNMERLRISPYSVEMRESMDQNNSEYKHFSRRGFLTSKLTVFLLASSHFQRNS